jgi:hypothetical protein
VPWIAGGRFWIEQFFAGLSKPVDPNAPEPESFDPAAIMAAANRTAQRNIEAIKSGIALESLAPATGEAPAHERRLPHPYRARR